MKFDPTVNIPTIFAAITLAVGAAAAWSSSNERHAKVETAVVHNNAVVAAQNERIKLAEDRLMADRAEFKQDILRTLAEIKADVREIKNSRR